MPDIFYLFFKYYLFFVSAFILFYSAGHLCLKLVSGYISIHGFFANIFFKSLTGLFASVIIYSFIHTHFKTINSGFFLISGFLLREFFIYKKKKQQKIQLRIPDPDPAFTGSVSSWKKIYPLLITSLFIYAWFAMIILRAGEFSLSLPPCDTIFYADISKIIGITGEENTHGISNLISKDFYGLTPYHYFELWLNDALASAFQSIHINSLYLITYPLLNFITLLGLCSMIAKVTEITFLHQISAFLFLFVSGLYFNNSSPSTDFTLNMAESSMELYGEKFSMYAPVIIGSFIFFIEGYFSLAIVILLVVPLISMSTAPGVFAGALLYSLFAFISGRIEKQVLLRIVFFIFSIAAFIFLLYYLTGNLRMNHTFNKGILAYTDISQFNYLSLKIFAVELFYRVKNSFLHLILLYAPFIVLSVWLLFPRKNLNLYLSDLFFLAASVCLSSLVFYQAFYKLRDSWQFYTNNLVLLNILMILVLIIIFFRRSATNRENRVKKVIFAGVMFLLAIRGINSWQVSNQYKKNNNKLFSSAYLAEIRNTNLNKKEKLPGALIYNAKHFYPFESQLSANVTPYLALMPQYLPCVYLGSFENLTADILPNEKSENNNIEYSVFYQFIKEQKKANTFINIEQSQLDFIEKYGLKYLIVSEDVKPGQSILEKAEKIITDPNSKQKFILLK